MSEKLLPCPFCGSANGVIYATHCGSKWGYAECRDCTARANEVRTGYDESADAAWHRYADEEWNRRAPDPVRDEALSTAFWERDSNAVLLGRAEQVRDEALGLLREWQAWVEGGNTSAGDIEDRTKALFAREEADRG